MKLDSYLAGVDPPAPLPLAHTLHPDLPHRIHMVGYLNSADDPRIAADIRNVVIVGLQIFLK